MFSSSVWRGANWDCSSAEASFPSAVLRIAWRTLSTPTLPPAAAGPAAGLLCAHAAPELNTQAASAATRIDAILEFTLFSL
jgi:hypothetical protein